MHVLGSQEPGPGPAGHGPVGPIVELPLLQAIAGGGSVKGSQDPGQLMTVRH